MLAVVLAQRRYVVGPPDLTDQDDPDEDLARPVERGGRLWERGTTETVRWIQRGFQFGVAITSSIPPVFEAHATVVDPWGDDEEFLHAFDSSFRARDCPDGAWLTPRHTALRETSPGWQVQQRLVEILSDYGSSSWWLGYLDTGSDDVVFDQMRGVKLYVGWPYKLVKAGPEQALSWRVFLPDLIFPDDHTWCLSTGWDDSWTCLGGPAEMIDRLRRDPVVSARVVTVDQDSTPPGHIAI